VAVVQCTFTHKQYTERHKRDIKQATQKFCKSAGRAPSLRIFPLHLPTTEEKERKTSVRVAEEYRFTKFTWRPRFGHPLSRRPYISYVHV